MFPGNLLLRGFKGNEQNSDGKGEARMARFLIDCMKNRAIYADKKRKLISSEAYGFRLRRNIVFFVVSEMNEG